MNKVIAIWQNHSC